MKTSLSVVALILAAAALGFAVFGGKTPAVDLGAAAGPDVSPHTFFRDNITVGGSTFATSSQGTATYTATSLVNAKLVEHNATAALTATLPTNALLSSAGFLPSAGDSKEIYIHASTTKITLAGATGVTLTSASTTKDVLANTTSVLNCVRLGATEGRLIQCFLSN